MWKALRSPDLLSFDVRPASQPVDAHHVEAAVGRIAWRIFDYGWQGCLAQAGHRVARHHHTALRNRQIFILTGSKLAAIIKSDIGKADVWISGRSGRG